MSTSATGVTKFSLVILPVSDQDRAISFWEGLGLEKRVDTGFAGGTMRWVEVYAPVGDTGIALAPPPPGYEMSPHATGITLQSEDIDKTHTAFSEQGVDVDPEIMRSGEPGVPHMFWFRDPDGYTAMVIEPT